MARTNLKKAASKQHTHEGAVAARINPEQQLKRLVLAHLLWEDTFYVDGKEAAEAMIEAVAGVPAEKVKQIAIEARTKMKLRHVPLLLAYTMTTLKTHRSKVAETLVEIIQRPDELTEYLSLYWQSKDNGKRRAISGQSKKGLAAAFRKFSEYQLAKYDREGAVKLRDVLFLSHAKPINAEQDELWKRLKDGKLATPDTWEVAQSATKGDAALQRQQWERQLSEGKIKAMALLRNLRNMREAGVPESLIFEALIKLNVSRVLPFRFITAARHNPQFASAIEAAMFRAVEGLPKLPGKTILVVDNSGSMYNRKISEKSELDRIDAACALAILAREACERCVVIGFGTEAAVIPDLRGFGLSAAIKAGPGSGTNTATALNLAVRQGGSRIIVITDEQSHQTIGPPPAGVTGYFINVANYKNGIGYGAWTNFTGWSEALLQYIAASEGLTDGSQAEDEGQED